MVLTTRKDQSLNSNDQLLFVAGWLDYKNDEQTPDVKEKNMLAVYNAGNGQKVSTYNLDSPPVWDGLIAANDNLFLATQEGQVMCLQSK
jgi:hypothetical protein